MMNNQGKIHHLSQIIVFLVLVCWLVPIQALVQGVLTYQGYLTDTDGAPIGEV